MLDDVRNLELSGFRSDTAAGPQPVIWLNQVAGALITGSRIPQEVALFLRVSGRQTREISVIGNDLRHAHRITEVAAGARGAALSLSGNLTARRLLPID